MVSLLVSFTLTPMMCSRMLRVSAGAGGHNAARSRQGFYRWIDAGYMAVLSFSMRHRFAVALLGASVIALAVPTYRLIRQDYLPTNVDDGAFEVRVTAPEGLSLAAMDDLMRTFVGKLKSLPGVDFVLGTSGGDYNGAISSGRIFVKLVPYEERVFSWSRLAGGIAHLDPLEAFRHNLSQRDVMTAARRQLAPYRDVKFHSSTFKRSIWPGPDPEPTSGFHSEARKSRNSCSMRRRSQIADLSWVYWRRKSLSN
jgi:HAE1 family hydrophobic/amphiphilic exporter-1